MNKQALRSFIVAAAVLSGGLADAQTTPVKAVAARVNVYQYAVDNPVGNSAMRSAPTLGASVPSAVELIPCENEKTYAYFYYDGRPVLVDTSTRSVVRIGQ